MIKFDVIEINFIYIYAGKTKSETIDNIIEAVPDFTDREFIGIAERVIDKLDLITESEFTEHNFSEQFADVAD
ncbi:MAG: transposon-transfer assisting family protein [Oscillospiraceae bacterium]|jgi:hypothetical protein|nr:transposon-transfer assisting family protein [Oscillospiraceae bacterium]